MSNVTEKKAGQICAKCAGAGKLDWTDNDGGICYKCEGQGYIGEMPEGFSKNLKELKTRAKQMLTSSLINRRSKGEKALSCSHCTGDFFDGLFMIENNLVFKYKYDSFFMPLPDMTVSFGFDTHKEEGVVFSITVGGEFVEIKAAKRAA